MQPLRPQNGLDFDWDDLQEFEAWLDRRVAGRTSDIVATRRHLHKHPEPSGLETETTRFLANELSRAGLTPRECDNGVGVIADLDIGPAAEDLPRVAVRADIDGLRLDDEKTVEYRSSRPGVAHACGHDAHATMVLETARCLAAGRQSATLPSEQAIRLRFVFQPAEETCTGARWMVRQGALDGVNSIVALHVDPQCEVGHVGIRYGLMTAHCDELAITVEGRGGHAARPHDTTDVVGAAALLITTLYQNVPRSIDARRPGVLTIGRIASGQALNVIPSHVELEGSLRTTDVATREMLRGRIREICDGVAVTTRNHIQLEFSNALSAVRNHRHVTSVVEAASCRVLDRNAIQTIHEPSMGGEDFSVYLDYVPGTQFRLGCASPGVEWPLLHSPVFDIDERALALGIRILSRSALMLARCPVPADSRDEGS